MAVKRMFSLHIVDSDAFLDMPTSTQLLYFHLCMRADDEGFVGNPKKIMRMLGASDDDYKLLIAKRFLLIFESSVMVIKHWLIHNTIRMDRFNPTTYEDEKKLLNVKENKAYTVDGNQLATTGLPTGNQLATQHKLSKVNLIEVKETKVEASLSFLEKLPEAIKGELSEKYAISPKGIQSKATDLTLYCKQNGKKYKDYKAFLENALRKDKTKLQNEFPLKVIPTAIVQQEPELSPEMIEKNRIIRENISKMLKR